MAKYKKKRVRELQHDRFRDTTITLFDRLGDLLEGKGRSLLYGIAGLILVALIVGFWLRWSHRKDDEARRALGRAITIATTPVSSTPSATATTPSYTSEQERAQKAVEEFQKVATKYGEPYRAEARYFMATNLISIDRDRAISELAELSKSSNVGVMTLAKFALAQEKEAEGKYDEATQLYGELAKQNNEFISADTANLRLALAYEKQGKKKEASDLLFSIVESARKAKDTDGAALPQSAAARSAAQELQKLDPNRYAQLSPEAPAADLTF